MSVDATRWAWTVEVSKSTERLVLLSLADRANEDNCCYPSMERVTKDTMLDIKTVKKVITDLITQGLIEDTGERKGQTQKVRVLRLIGVDCREVKRTQKRNDSKNGMIPNFPSNEPKFGFLNEPKFGTQNLKENLKENLTNNNKREAQQNEDEVIKNLTRDDTRKRFAMTLDWIPNKQFFAGYCSSRQIKAEKLTNEILSKFREDAHSKAQIKTEAEWCLCLAKRLQSAVVDGQVSKPTSQYQAPPELKPIVTPPPPKLTPEQKAQIDKEMAELMKSFGRVA